ncbi:MULTISPECIES: N-acyl homoserine lactonase family protein [Ensifer]|jgi:N-acyl homoserine lactone hydrolase|uniref:N-acyl homoserine lactonase family protein n=1 Tax=Ensifer TaxID=106591 RepID=UPI000712F6C1|nr:MULTISPECIES: N-acyl homoserine lactonase family protein [Ensifer]KQX43174.1 MBL fold metallo-hydrolase [Ensifer sp. Root1298]KQX72723.1 MBL fold metallo-hydrolase [Ensifer sp. Root1312]KRC15689.1 MBL fold metallo-hydrolase [Ensifer sp. Root74]KRD58964.1 MBL fold metallo-hydrolase [Ensifer sp. Root954]
MKMHFLAGGRLRMRRSIYFSGAAKEETIELPVHATLIRHSQGNVLFDSGCNPGAAIDPQARWGGLSKVMTPIFAPEQTVVSELKRLGLTPGDIDVVICSHLHPDHCGCNASFRRATILCHEAELDAAKADGAEQQGYLKSEWEQPQGFQTFRDEHDVFGDARVVLLPMPGHTPGMTVTRLTLERDGTFILASDAAPLQKNIDDGIAPKNTWNMDLAEQALGRLKTFRDGGDTVISGHDDTQWQTLRKGTEFYE